VYGAWDNIAQSGSWAYTVNAFANVECDPNFQYYSTVTTGTYHITGKESEDVDKFWNVEYRVNTKTFEATDAQFANDLLDENDCELTSVVPFTIVEIRHESCRRLQILPIRGCVVMYDIVRRQGNYLWIGDQFTGDDQAWLNNCHDDQRPKVADPYYFVRAGSRNYDYGVDLDVYVTGTDVFATSEFDRNADDFGFDGYIPVLEDDNSSSVFTLCIGLLVAALML
jgi:hypothetical protein